jgi:hypothetical protein
MKMLMVPAALLLFTAGCATTGKPPQAASDPAMAKALAGKVAGAPKSCISLTESRSSTTYREAILYRVNRNLVYLNDLGKCSALRRDNIQVTDVRGSQLCRGDIVRMVDRGSGMQMGACAFSDFVPYRTPDK